MTYDGYHLTSRQAIGFWLMRLGLWAYALTFLAGIVWLIAAGTS